MTSSPDNKLYHLEGLMPLIRQRLAEGRSICIGPKGTSMMPLIRQGIDYVELSALPDRLKKYDLPLYQRRDGHYVLHRIVGVGETYTCVGDNQNQLEHGLTHDQMIAVVTAVYRGEKRISVDSFGYRFYCRFWHFTRPVRHFFRSVKAFLRHRLGLNK